MSPLLLLLGRSLFNGIKRSVTSGKRLIGIAFLGLYYVLMFRPMTSGGWNKRPQPPLDLDIQVPPMLALQALVFAGFALGSVLCLLGLFGYRGGFSKSDVDVLFPTPVSPRMVVVFRLVRDTLVTLLLPILMLVFAYRPASEGWGSIVKGLPAGASPESVLRLASIAWLLMSFCFVAIGYAISAYFNRPVEGMEAKKRAWGWAIFGYIAIVLGFVSIGLRDATGIYDVVNLSQSGWLKALLPFATGATLISTAAVTGNWLGALMGVAVLVLPAIIGVVFTMQQAGWIYEHAATTATDQSAIRDAARKQDVYGAIAAHARTGKFKPGSGAWVKKLKLIGPKALIWKEMILMARVWRATFILFVVIGTALSAMPVFLFRSKSEPNAGLAFLLFQVMAVFMVASLTASTGFIELLRRVDLQKPLPFTSGVTLFYEIIAKAVPCAVLALLGAGVVLIGRPALWEYAIATLIATPALALLLVSVYCLIIVLFPDVDDPTQRSFRGLMQVLGLALFCAPPALLFIGLRFIKVDVVLAAVPVMAICVGLSALAAYFAGRLYVSFNPSE